MGVSEQRDKLLKSERKCNDMVNIGTFDVVRDGLHGNSSRFCNQSCEPSAEYRVAKFDFADTEMVVVTVLKAMVAGTKMTVATTGGRTNIRRMLPANAESRLPRV